MSKNVVILGIGESGVGAALLAQSLGEQVFLSDLNDNIKDEYLEELRLKGIDYEVGIHDVDRILEADLVIKSPGIPNDAAIIKKIQDKNIEIIGEIEYAYRNVNPGSKIIAITGSNGKTTTTSLCYQIFRDSDVSTAAVGNIGLSFSRQIARSPKDVYVLEVSSFQLDDVISFKPDIAILLNITPDHLDRYSNEVDLYAQSKMRITENQTANDYFIYNEDDKCMAYLLKNHTINSQKIPFSMNKSLEENHNGASFIDDNGNLVIQIEGKEDFKIPQDEIGIKGKHNLYNTMAAGIPARIMDLRSEKIRQSMMDYKGLEHRLEHVASVGGVEYINDSKATNLNSVWYALECMTKPTVLILGGVDKGNDYNIILDLVKEKVKGIVALGVDNEKIINFFSKENNIAVKETKSMGAAVAAASDIAINGEVVLLSPACASFDLFDNYQDRGEQFKAVVRAL